MLSLRRSNFGLVKFWEKVTLNNYNVTLKFRILRPNNGFYDSPRLKYMTYMTGQILGGNWR